MKIPPVSVGLLLMVLATLVGCQVEEKQPESEMASGGQSENYSASTAQDLQGTAWRLVSLDGESVTAEEEQRRPWIQFPADGKSIQGVGGCNQFGGSYQLDGQSLQFGPIAATKMYCTGIMAVEQGLFEALRQSSRWHIKDHHLELYDAEDNLLARFEAKPDAAVRKNGG